MMLQIDINRWFAMVAILSIVSDFNENWYLGVFSSEELVGNDETCIHMPEFWYGISWRILCLHPNIIKPSYSSSSSSSSSSPNELVRPNSQRLMIRSLLNFTARWIPISRGALKSWNFQNGYRFHGNVNICQNLLPHLYRKLPKGFPQDLIYILSRVGRIFLPKKNRERMAAILKMTADKIGKISMFSDFNGNLYLWLFWSAELIGNDENCIQGHFYFQNGRQQNRQNFNVL